MRTAAPVRRTDAPPSNSERSSMHALSLRSGPLARGVAALALLATFSAFAPAARAHGLHAHATLYARADGDDVKALVEIRIDPSFHLYHGPTAADMGPSDVVGVPTTFEFQGDAVEWSGARFPKPEQEEEDTGTAKVTANVHVGSPRFWFRGHRTKEFDLAKLELKVNGLTCNMEGCVPYGETVTSSGRGTDKPFA